MGLDGVRVLEIGEMVAAPYAAKLLADEGAEVIKVEPPTGDRARSVGPFRDNPDPNESGLFVGLNTNKSSVVLDLDVAAGVARLAELVAEADIVLHDMSPARAASVGLDPEVVLVARPELVMCAVTPFGSSGPQAEWRGDEICVANAGGWAWLSPGALRDAEQAPLKAAGHVSNMQGGLAAAMVALAAFDHAERTGRGEFIDMSVQAHVASMLETALPLWTYSGEIQDRFKPRIRNPWFIVNASDGLIFLVTVEADQWQRLVEMMGSPAWALDEKFADFPDRMLHGDELRRNIEAWTSQHTVEALFHEGQSRRVCFAPVFRMADLEGQEHLQDRGFFHSLDQTSGTSVTHMGSGAHVTPSSWRLMSGAPELAPQNDVKFSPRTSSPRPFADAVDRAKPLAGVTVVDFSWVWAGPFCTLQLAHLGADVIKVESSKRPGLGRRLPIYVPGLPETLNSCGYFNQWDQGKRSADIDLSSPDGLAQVQELIRTADVVVDNFATGVMHRMGLGDDVLRSLNPNVIIASITGFGHSGPLRDYMGYGPTTAPLSGLTSLTGYDDGEPREVGISFGDPAAGLTAAHAIVSAIVSRRRTGVAPRVDVSLWEATAVNAVYGWMAHALGAEPDKPMGNRDPVSVPHGCYRAAGEDAWVSIACGTDAEWERLADMIDPALVSDDRFTSAASRKHNENELDAVITEWTRQRDRWDVTKQLQAAGVGAYPSLDARDLVDNEQLVARQFFAALEHPEVGARVHAGAPWLMRNSSAAVERPAPLIGQHTQEVLDLLASR